ncbi:preprotein translocase subunit SecG [Sphingomonas flavalba]|uniref:preprotein translocase subunit SecG n=1 Tax=Sphingomonas flavalba TaxID=2559804 RepID=UPI0039E05DBE
MFTFLLVVQAIVAAALVGIILMQKSEGGGLGMGGGGSPAGLMSARGAADFLTRATTVLATIFILLSITLAFVAAHSRKTTEIDTSLAAQAPAAQQQGEAPPLPVDDPLAAAAEQATGGGAPAPVAAPAPAASPTAAATPAPKAAATPTPAASPTSTN